VILKGTIIEDNCVIGAGSVIKGEIPANSTVIQKRSTEIQGGVSRLYNRFRWEALINAA